MRPYNHKDGRTPEEQQEKIQAVYGWYLLNFEPLEPYTPQNKCFFRWFSSGFVNAFTLGAVKKSYHCPRCCTKIDKFTYNYHPIYTFGCERCRVKTPDEDIE